jgi:hypothetical protein
MRIIKAALDELIENEGELKHGPINSTGVLRLALDLQDARARVVELEQELTELGEIADGVHADVRLIRAKYSPAPASDALAAFEASQPPPRRNPRHRSPRAAKT